MKRGPALLRQRRRLAFSPALLPCLVAGLIGFGLLRPAEAQISAPVVVEGEISRDWGATTPRNFLPWWISQDDCREDHAFSFPVDGLTGNDPLEIWVGNEDCASTRGNDDRGQCWIVARVDQPDAQGEQVRVPVRNVVAQIQGTLEPPSGLTNEVCVDDDTNGQAVTFYFMLIDGGLSAASTTWDPDASGGTGFDLLGPDPPGGISVGVGDSQLSIRLDDVDEESDRERFQAFCVPAEPASRNDAGAGEVPGADAGATEGPAPTLEQCFTPRVSEGAPPPLDFGCGSASEITGTISTTPLINDQVYAVAVSATDLLGNAGVLSEVECGRPVELDDFFEVYVRSGGTGGGGFCSVASPGSSRHSRKALGTWLAAFAMLTTRRWWRHAGRRPRS